MDAIIEDEDLSLIDPCHAQSLLWLEHITAYLHARARTAETNDDLVIIVLAISTISHTLELPLRRQYRPQDTPFERSERSSFMSGFAAFGSSSSKSHAKAQGAFHFVDPYFFLRRQSTRLFLDVQLARAQRLVLRLRDADDDAVDDGPGDEIGEESQERYGELLLQELASRRALRHLFHPD